MKRTTGYIKPALFMKASPPLTSVIARSGKPECSLDERLKELALGK
jgi:hypothetical protein